MERESLVIYAFISGDNKVSLHVRSSIFILTFCIQGPYGTSLGFYFFSNLMYSVYSLSWVIIYLGVSPSLLTICL